MHLSEFVAAAVAGKGGAHIVLDSKTDQLKTYRQDRFSRVIQWCRDRISPNRHRQIERDGALNLFMTAIAAHAAYNTSDANRARALLSADACESRPLTSRRILQVMKELDERSTQTERDNRITASFMAERGVEMRLREQDSNVVLGPEDRERLAEGIREAIHDAGRNGRHKVGLNEATAVTNRLVDDLVAEKTAVLEAAAAAEAAARAAAAARLSADGEGTDTQAPSQAPGAQVGSPRPAQVAPAAPQQLLRALDKAGLPAEVRNQVRRAVRTGEAANMQDLAHEANRRIAAWVMENRMGKWCGEIQLRLGLIQHVRQGDYVTAPSSLLERVRKAIENSPELRSYSEIKTLARALIDARMREEASQRSAAGDPIAGEAEAA